MRLLAPARLAPKFSAPLRHHLGVLWVPKSPTLSSRSSSGGAWRNVSQILLRRPSVSETALCKPLRPVLLRAGALDPGLGEQRQRPCLRLQQVGVTAFHPARVLQATSLWPYPYD